MAAEGDFPKVDGDILYASEANKFSYLDSWSKGKAITTAGSWTTPEVASER